MSFNQNNIEQQYSQAVIQTSVKLQNLTWSFHCLRYRSHHLKKLETDDMHFIYKKLQGKRSYWNHSHMFFISSSLNVQQACCL